MNTEQIFKSIDSKEPAMLKFLETLVNIDSAKDSLEGIHQVAEHIKLNLSNSVLMLSWSKHPVQLLTFLVTKRQKIQMQKK